MVPQHHVPQRFKNLRREQSHYLRFDELRIRRVEAGTSREPMRCGAIHARERPGGIFSIDIAGADGQEFPNLGCFLDVIPMERLAWTSMLFPGYRPAVFDDIPITAIMTMESVGTGTRYVFTALHRDEADFEKNKASGWQQGTEIALEQLVAHVTSMK